MAIYTTGRTRTLTFNGTWSGTSFSSSSSGLWAGFAITIDALDARFVLSSGYQAVGGVGEIGPYNCLLLQIFYGIIHPPVCSSADGPCDGSATDFNYTGSGSWSISVPVEEVVNIYQDAPPSGGSAEMPPTTHYVIYEQQVADESIVVTASFGGVGCTHSIPTTGGAEVSYAVGVSLTAYCSNGNDSNPSNSSTAQVAISSPTVWGIPYYYEIADDSSNVPGYVNGNGGNPIAYIELLYDSGTNLWSEVGVVANFTYYISQAYTINGVVRAFQDAFPADLQVNVANASGALTNPVDIPAGSFGISDVQRQGSAGGYWQVFSGASYQHDFTTSYSILEQGAISLNLTTASLTASGDDVTDTRMMFRGWNWNALTLTQAATTEVDSAPSTSNWIAANSHTTVANTESPAPPGIIITVDDSAQGSVYSTLATAAPAALKGTSWQGVSFAGYRYLRLSLTVQFIGSETSQTARLQIVTPLTSTTSLYKYWNLQVLESGTIDVDLCAPDSISIVPTPTTDTKDSKWPFAQLSGASPWFVTDSAYWGVSNVYNQNTSSGGFILDMLSIGHTYTLTDVHLRRSDHSSITFIPGFKDWVEEYPPVTSGGTTTTTYMRRFVDGDTDGRRSLEQQDYIWTDVASGGSPTDTYSPNALVNLAISTTGGTFPSDGWSGTDLRPAPTSGCPDSNGNYPLNPCFLNSSAPLTFAFGAGAYFNGKTWSYGFNLNCNSSLTIPAQTLFDTISFYPQCGDVWGWAGGQYGGPLQLYAAAILRGQASGLVIDTTNEGAAGVTVQLNPTGSPTISSGVGVTDGLGEYKNALPYPKGNSSNTVTAEQGPMPYPYVTETFINRKRLRSSFLVPVVPECCKKVWCVTPIFFPFRAVVGDHYLLPLEAWRQIPDVTGDGDSASSPNTTQPLTAAGSPAGKGNG